ncbi:MAG: response regulator transcription factor [Saprospiraceae bacterium]|nr:response regulator transcription factor [Saprospiraceae bacterium]HMW40049.1 response regulator transcription factor [Saprospiraceae bacterium]HMX89568.1 response regulator transcription factor [Saprospiraceae bacterium]HMZ41078.1 response regulator transcription factor [Saprospiraceae bacterium]HNA65423.1 response regulator transcription factor [Saprospiraceae bacterium]
MISIAILEDLKEVALLLQEQLNATEDLRCLQVYHNAEDAMYFLPKNPVDILIVDIGLPRASGIEAIRTLGESCPAMQFCMFTVYEDDDKIFQSLQAGAKGYLLKGSSASRIAEAVRELYRGGSPMSPSIARRILDAFVRVDIPASVPALPITAREKELLEHLSRGLLYKEIAVLMDITTGTVKQHIHKIYGKLQVQNRTEAINKLKNM